MKGNTKKKSEIQKRNIVENLYTRLQNVNKYIHPNSKDRPALNKSSQNINSLENLRYKKQPQKHQKYFNYSNCQTSQNKFNTNTTNYFISQLSLKNKNSKASKLIEKISKSYINYHQDNQPQDSNQNTNLKKQSISYKNLHDKLNLLQNKISQMKISISMKREQKNNFVENKNNKPIKNIQNLNQKDVKNNTNPLKKLVTQFPMQKSFNRFNFNPYSPKHNTYYVSEIVKGYKDLDSLARDHVKTSINILKAFENVKLPTKQELSSRMVYLQKKPGYQNKKTLLLDLDETLIHCNETFYQPCDVIIPIQFGVGEIVQAGINIRPYAIQFLKTFYQKFEIIIFTASHSIYANAVIDHLDPQRKYIQHRLYRQHCWQTPQGIFVKDLRIINRNLSEMTLVDNAAYSYAFQIDNGIPILPYYQGKVDYELKGLETYLYNIILRGDVRDQNRKTFKLSKYTKFNDIEELVKNLYNE